MADAPVPEIPDNWYAAETSMYFNLVGGDPYLAADQGLQTLFHHAMFSDLSGQDQQAVYQLLITYMLDEYDLDFDDVFDWEAYSEWYEHTSG